MNVRGKKRKKITILEVAREAGVCIATVSRVLNNKADVGEEYTTQVEAAIKKLGYRIKPTSTQQPEKTRHQARHGNVGLLVDGSFLADFLGTPLNHEFVTSIENKTRELNLNFLFESLLEYQTETELPHCIKRGNVDGLIIKADQERGISMALALAPKIPVVLVPYRAVTSTVPTVYFNDGEGVRCAMQYLYNIGHRKIGFFMIRDINQQTNTTKGFSFNERRFEYYQELVRELGCISHPSYAETPVRNWSTHTLEDVISDALDRWLSMGRDRPTAIFTSHDIYALPMINLARKKGLNIPQDLSIVGYQNIPDAKKSDPQLTSVRIPGSEMGTASINILNELIQNPQAPIPRLELSAQLIERSSCSTPHKAHKIRSKKNIH